MFYAGGWRPPKHCSVPDMEQGPLVRSIPYGCGEIVEVHDERHLESEDSEYRNKIYCLLQLACNSTLRNYEINAVSSIHDLQYGFLVNQLCLHGSEG